MTTRPNPKLSALGPKLESLYTQGLTIKQAAKELGIGQESARKWLKARGFTVWKIDWRGMEEQLERYYAAGNSLEATGDHFGVSSVTVWKYLKAKGLTRPRSKHKSELKNAQGKQQ